MSQLLNEKQLKAGVQIIRDGGLVAVRTETVYVLCADALNEAAVRKVFAAKNRPLKKALSIQFPSIKAMVEFFPAMDTATLSVFKSSKSGLTVVLPKPVFKSAVKPIATSVLAGGDTVAVRIPSDKFMCKFLRACGVPLAVPSANTSGMPFKRSWQEVNDDLGKRIDAIFTSKPCKLGVESTVVQLVTEKGTTLIKILRAGAIPPEKLTKKTGLQIKS